MKELYIARSGKESGPFTEEQIPSMVDAGMLSLRDSIWHAGLTEWIPVYQYLGKRPPVPAETIPPQPPPVIFAAPPIVKPVSPPKSGDPAPFWPRFGAHWIDLVAVSVWTFLCMIILLGIGIPVMMITGEESILVDFYGFIAFALSLVVPGWLYHAYWESSKHQASPGKRTFGLVVTDLEGKRLSFKQASRRAGLKSFSNFLTFGLIYLTSMGSDKKQCLHDVISGTMVRLK